MKLLRIEGVNLAHSIDDTENLSVRRGGSLMLLDAINVIAENNKAHLEKISTGASAGLFKVTGDVNTALVSINSLLAQEPYCHGTFVVNQIETAADFRQSEITAVAANRWSQMQSLSFSPKGLSVSAQVCTMDEVRPAAATATVKGEKQVVSASVQARQQHGRTMKQVFYRRILGDHYADRKSADDFEDIAGGSVSGLSPKTLIGKIAVFYADGNNFGNVARACKTADELTEWDNYIKGQRKALLSKLLDHASGKSYWKNAGALRLETLLWGGDELMFVVPGWCGLELAKLFIEQTKGMQYQVEGKIQQLTHACGLVFCHQQAPISRISHLAKELAEKGKQANRKTNSLNWLVLESFDHTGSGLDDYLRRRFVKATDWPDLVLNEVALASMTSDFASLRKELPRSAIVRVARALAEDRAFNDDGKINELVRRARLQVAKAGDEHAQSRFKDLWKHLHGADWLDEPTGPDDLGAWIKLAELWDYCPEWKPKEEVANRGEQA